MAVFLSGCVLGGAGMFMWQAAHTPLAPSCPHPLAQVPLPLARLEQAALPEDMQEANLPDNTPKSSQELPSQLVRSNLPEDIVLGAPAEDLPQGEKPAGVVLSDGQNTVVLQSQRPPQRAADGTNITMIEAPLSLKRIQTLDEYKEFKRTARGSYPAADFDKEEVLVLESASNLPDKVFEIVDVEDTGSERVLHYRVNVFGLGEKPNTHSALKVDKTAQPIVLEQVL